MKKTISVRRPSFLKFLYASVPAFPGAKLRVGARFLDSSRLWPLCGRFTILTQQIGPELVARQVIEEGGEHGNNRNLDVIQRRRGFQVGASEVGVASSFKVFHRVVQIVGDVVEIGQNRGLDKVRTTLGYCSSIRGPAQNLQA